MTAARLWRPRVVRIFGRQIDHAARGIGLGRLAAPQGATVPDIVGKALAAGSVGWLAVTGHDVCATMPLLGCAADRRRVVARTLRWIRPGKLACDLAAVGVSLGAAVSCSSGLAASAMILGTREQDK